MVCTPLALPSEGVVSFEYIASYYGKTFKKGQIVRALGKLGVVVKATHYVFVRLDDEEHAKPYHPSDVEVTS